MHYIVRHQFVDFRTVHRSTCYLGSKVWINSKIWQSLMGDGSVMGGVMSSDEIRGERNIFNLLGR